ASRLLFHRLLRKSLCSRDSLAPQSTPPLWHASPRRAEILAIPKRTLYVFRLPRRSRCFAASSSLDQDPPADLPIAPHTAVRRRPLAPPFAACSNSFAEALLDACAPSAFAHHPPAPLLLRAVLRRSAHWPDRSRRRRGQSWHPEAPAAVGYFRLPLLRLLLRLWLAPLVLENLCPQVRREGLPFLPVGSRT